jgi:hypothetical protein
MPITTTNSSQKNPLQVLATIFSSAARVAVLRVFMIDPRRAYYQRQLEEVCGLPLRAVQRELERLAASGLLYRRAEGNRAYYQVDVDFPLFPELRAMVMKSVGDVDAVRAALAWDEGVRLAFLHESGDRVLVVTRAGKRFSGGKQRGIGVEVMTSEEFMRALSDKSEVLNPYLVRGADVLGRREDVIWRHIAAAGYDVKKGEGVP